MQTSMPKPHPHPSQHSRRLFFAAISLLLCATSAAGTPEKPYSPYAQADAPKKVYWGDTHLHTNLSLDARAFGVTLTPESAYRFARGETVTSSNGEPVRLSTPLDFLVVSDHSDALGSMRVILDGDNPELSSDTQIRDWKSRLKQGGEAAYQAGMDVVGAFTQGNVPKAALNDDIFNSAWAEQLDAAERFNDPGRFTAMIGYEWTSTPKGNNLHRNVLYRDGADRAKQLAPFTAAESLNPFDLWKWMERYERITGGHVLALAHNGNMSNGLMFPEFDPETGKPFTDNYLEMRARWEPIYEVSQIKGDGEAHPYLSPNDEFADYENWDKANMGPTPKQDHMLKGEYAREALKQGLKIAKERGVNPYKFGMLASTDSHTALSTGDEDNFFGKMAYMEPSKTRWKEKLGGFGDVTYWGWEMVGSGYAAVWAEDNTREAIFDAMQRREIYATTGPRIVLKFDAKTGSDIKPMGSDLGRQRRSPEFIVHAMKDPLGANLDRVQIVKGWLDDQGNTHEKVYNVAWSDNRRADNQGRIRRLFSTVNVEKATYTNTIGAASLSASWKDPEFDKQQAAFYYARVIQIPTPRWSAYDALRLGAEIDAHIPMTTQDRAYSSPIWVNSVH